MLISLDETRIRTIEQVRAVLDGTRALDFTAAATRGEPRLVRAAGRICNDDQAFVSWICVTWVVLTLCQLAVTVAGNLGVIPLTGVTFPFVSFGMTSLVVNMSMLALAVNVNARAEAISG